MVAGGGLFLGDEMSKTSKLYILCYPDESPTLYKLGTSSDPNQRVNELRKPGKEKHKDYQGYSGRIEIVAVFFITDARKAEGMLSRFLQSYRIPRENAMPKFGTFEIYRFTDDELSHVIDATRSMFVGLR